MDINITRYPFIYKLLYCETVIFITKDGIFLLFNSYHQVLCFFNIKNLSTFIVLLFIKLFCSNHYNQYL